MPLMYVTRTAFALWPATSVQRRSSVMPIPSEKCCELHFNSVVPIWVFGAVTTFWSQKYKCFTQYPCMLCNNAFHPMVHFLLGICRSLYLSYSEHIPQNSHTEVAEARTASHRPRCPLKFRMVHLQPRFRYVQSARSCYLNTSFIQYAAVTQ